MKEPAEQISLLKLQNMLKEFVAEREWEKFHTPKNLATALSVEASELLEPFQWLSRGDRSELSESMYKSVYYEIADVFSYLVLLADKLEIDIYEAVLEKIKLNREKYPVEKARGNAQKYSEYR